MLQCFELGRTPGAERQGLWPLAILKVFFRQAKRLPPWEAAFRAVDQVADAT